MSELIQFFELLIKRQALAAAAGTHLNETIRKIREAPNDYQKMALLMRAFEEDPTLLDQLRAATGEPKGTFMHKFVMYFSIKI